MDDWNRGVYWKRYETHVKQQKKSDQTKQYRSNRRSCVVRLVYNAICVLFKWKYCSNSLETVSNQSLFAIVNVFNGSRARARFLYVFSVARYPK